MNQTREFRGYYCRRCHTYTRLYRKKRSAEFRGTCSICGVEIIVDANTAENALFFTGGKKYRTINIWNSYRRGKIIGQVEAGTGALILGKAEYNGVTWYHVRSGNLTGWVSGAFIRQLR